MDVAHSFRCKYARGWGRFVVKTGRNHTIHQLHSSFIPADFVLVLHVEGAVRCTSCRWSDPLRLGSVSDKLWAPPQANWPIDDIDDTTDYTCIIRTRAPI